MRQFKPIAIVLLLSALYIVTLACTRTQGAGGGEEAPLQAEEETGGALMSEPLYTAYNLWYENPDKISCVNYQRGARIPAGTRVNRIAIKPGRSDQWSGIHFTTEDGGSYVIQFAFRYHPGVSVEAFKNRLFTPKNYQELTRNMSAREIECVKSGTVRRGVSKECVLVSYGYPPEHKTSSLKVNAWIYWNHRFGTKAVQFNADGVTIGDQ